jgi:alpha-L-fucosidase
MQKLNMFRYLFIIFSLSCTAEPPDIEPQAVIPSSGQIAYQEMEMTGFIHFGINTFTDKEWGDGGESPELFNPTAFDAEQWARTAKTAGMKQLILTAKHHDGFCLWPSAYTEHSVKNSPWKNGEGDIVREFVDACRKYDLKAGLYLSPWDRNHADYGQPEYIEYYRNQLTELLTQYGDITEIWFDGANGGSGYYGGANETRRIDKKTYYEWSITWPLVKQLQPGALIFSDVGPDIHWNGNEKGIAGETNWSTITNEGATVGEADRKILNSGEPDGKYWIASECDVSIRPGWFYHTSQDTLVKSPQEIVDIYYKSVGRNGTFLLNLPPDQRGLIYENDVENLTEFRGMINETFAVNLAAGKTVTTDNFRLNHQKFSPAHLLDEDNATYWAADDDVLKAVLEVDLGAMETFDRILLQEPIRFGQRISEFSIEGFVDGAWTSLARGTTIGYKRLLRISPVTTRKVRLVILDALNTPAISSFGLYKASAKETVKG